MEGNCYGWLQRSVARTGLLAADKTVVIWHCLVLGVVNRDDMTWYMWYVQNVHIDNDCSTCLYLSIAESLHAMHSYFLNLILKTASIDTFALLT